MPLTASWLQYLNFKLSGLEPIAESRFACVCTPYMFRKYRGIFGLTGSVGGRAELAYLMKTYSAVKFDVPRFLDTCVGDARKQVKNHGVLVVDNEKQLIARVVKLCCEYFKLVPVLVITSSQVEFSCSHSTDKSFAMVHVDAYLSLSQDQLQRVYTALHECGTLPAHEVQRFAEFDDIGNSLADKWQTIIDDATKRLGGVADNRCRVTVTDRFGGRGHDFQATPPPSCGPLETDSRSQFSAMHSGH